MSRIQVAVVRLAAIAVLTGTVLLSPSLASAERADSDSLFDLSLQFNTGFIEMLHGVVAVDIAGWARVGWVATWPLVGGPATGPVIGLRLPEPPRPHSLWLEGSYVDNILKRGPGEEPVGTRAGRYVSGMLQYELELGRVVALTAAAGTIVDRQGPFASVRLGVRCTVW